MIPVIPVTPVHKTDRRAPWFTFCFYCFPSQCLVKTAEARFLSPIPPERPPSSCARPLRTLRTSAEPREMRQRPPTSPEDVSRTPPSQAHTVLRAPCLAFPHAHISVAFCFPPVTFCRREVKNGSRDLPYTPLPRA